MASGVTVSSLVARLEVEMVPSGEISTMPTLASLVPVEVSTVSPLSLIHIWWRSSYSYPSFFR